MSTKRTPTKPKNDSTQKEQTALSLEPFFLPGDAEAPPAKPCSLEELLTKVEKHLEGGRSPDHEVSKEKMLFLGVGSAASAMRELWSWLASHAVNGNLQAQEEIFDSALRVTKSFVTCAGKKLPGIVNRAKRANAIPGFISIDDFVQKDMERLCREIGQGKRFPFPSAPTGKKGKKRTGSLSTAQNHLVFRLWIYIEDGRLVRQWHPLFRREEIERRSLCVSPLLAAMLELPPLSVETVERWLEIGRRVINDRTNGNLLNHPAFQPGGIYETLGNYDKDKQEFAAFRKGMKSAWKLRAKELVALPESSKHRKDFSRQ